MELSDLRQPSPNAACHAVLSLQLHGQVTLSPCSTSLVRASISGSPQPAGRPLLFSLLLCPSANVTQHTRQVPELPYDRVSYNMWKTLAQACLLQPHSQQPRQNHLGSHGWQMENREDADEAGREGLVQSGRCLRCEHTGLNCIPRAYY